MTSYNPSNERVKRRYLAFLKEAKRHSEPTIDAVAKAIARFEEDTRCRDFKGFHYEQAVAFKRNLATQDSDVTGGKLSQATRYATLSHLKRFFQWLAGQPGYRSRLTYSDADYFNLSEKESRVATARRPRPHPTLEQVRHAISAMPSTSDVQKRDRAIVAFALLTGARDSAIASFSLKHLDLAAGCVYQDARDIKTKFSKTFTTYFFPVGADVRQVVESWVRYLQEERLWGGEDPLFPATNVVVGRSSQHFEAAGLKRAHWHSAAPIRQVFQNAFSAAGLPYFHPHSLRTTLAQLGESLCRSPEEFKAWSQNLGHEGVLTTFYSYGAVSTRRQGELIQNIGTWAPSAPDAAAFARAVARQLQKELAGRIA